MKLNTFLSTSVLACVLSAAGSMAFAGDTISPEDFVNEASAKNVAEIETSKLALEKSTATDVKSYAQKIITEHTASNMELAGIARRKNLEVADEAELINKAKKFVLEQRDGESFDEAYAKNQVNAHKDTIELFKKAAASADPELAGFAKATLPKLEDHLLDAQELVETHDKE